MKKVWAVSRGSYSDYHVLCICDSKKRAKAVAKAYDRDGFDDPFVEAIGYLDHDPQKVDLHYMSLEIFDDGSTGRDVSHSRSVWDFDTDIDELTPVKWRWIRAPYIEDRGGRLEVSGTDLELVRHVFSDRSAMLRSDDAMRAQTEARGRCGAVRGE